MATISITDKIKKNRRIKKPKSESSVKFSGWYTSTAVSQTGGAIAEPYLPLFAQNILGASNSEIGFLAGLFSLLNISQLIWAQLSLKIGYNKYFVFLGQLFTSLLFIPIAFLRFGHFVWLLVLRFFQGLFNSATIPTMATLKSDYISERDRANKITKFTYIGLTGSFIGTLAGGQLFDALHALTGKEETYSLIFMFTAFISIIGALLFFFSVPATNKTNILKDNLSPVSFVNRDLKQKNSHLSILKKTKGYLKKFRLFWIFTIFSMIFYFAVYSVGPFFILIEIDVFKFTFFEASIITSISIIDQVVISILLVRGNLLNKYGRKPFLGLGTLIIIIFSFLFLLPYFFLSLFSPILFLYCFFIWLLLGFGWGLFNSTIAVLILDIAHPQYRSVLIAYFNTFTGLMMFIGPVIGGITIDMTNNLITPFILRVVIITISLIYLIRFVKEPAISGIELKPLKNVFPFFTRMSSARGPELGISYGNEKLARKKHL